MIRTYKRKLKLSNAQEQRLLGWVGVCRLVFNMGLEIRQTAHGTGKSVHKFELMKQLTALREGFEWVKDVPSQTLQAAVERLDRAYQGFFKNGRGFPRFASKRRYKSLLFKYVKVEGNFVILPKIGKLRIFNDTEVKGVPKTATLKIEPAGFFICIQCENVPKKFNSENQTIGLDMGIAQFCVDSNGGMIANPLHFKKYERRLRIENRSLARKKKGSESWITQAKKLARLHHTIGNVRSDFLHKESTKIAKAYSTVYLEDLKISFMAKNKNLSKYILDCGWGMFRTMLEYKTNVVRVDPKYTSQTCSACGNVDKDSRISQSLFVCSSRGYTDNADQNAAQNILSRGTAVVRQREALACALGEEPQS